MEADDVVESFRFSYVGADILGSCYSRIPDSHRHEWRPIQLFNPFATVVFCLLSHFAGNLLMGSCKGSSSPLPFLMGGLILSRFWSERGLF